MPCIATSHSLVLASVLMWHSGEPSQPGNLLKGERNHSRCSCGSTRAKQLWGGGTDWWWGREEGEKHRRGMHQVSLGCTELSIFANTQKVALISVITNDCYGKWFSGKKWKALLMVVGRFFWLRLYDFCCSAYRKAVTFNSESTWLSSSLQ